MAVVFGFVGNVARSLSRASINVSRQYSQAAEIQKLVDVQIDEKTGIATTTLQNPPVNSLSLDVLSELGGALKHLEQNKCQGMILTSASPSVFCAGLDIMEMYEAKRERMATFWGTLQSTWLSLYRSSFPTVAVINGASPAGGCLLALSCEYRVMVGSDKFKIGLNETQLGIIPPVWFQLVMQDAIGRRQCEMALTQGAMFTPQEAHTIGLIDEIVPSKDAGIESAKKFIARFQKVPPLARKLTKETVRSEAIKWMEENMVEDIKIFVDFISQPAVQKGLGLYLQSLKK